MKRALVGLLLLTSCSLGRSADATGCTGLNGSELWQIDEQVAQRREVALYDYFFGPPTKSVRTLQELIGIYQRAQCTDLVEAVPRQAFAYEELLAAGRLARQYERLGYKAQSVAEREKAVALGRAILRKASWSVDDLDRLIDQIDPKQRAHLLQSGIGPEQPPASYGSSPPR
jgi:hypothetical protein